MALMPRREELPVEVRAELMQAWINRGLDRILARMADEEREQRLSQSTTATPRTRKTKSGDRPAINRSAAREKP
jgi:uncharacterized protein (DUF2336 family)